MTNLTNVAKMEKGNAVYIKSIEAADLFSHMNREQEITTEYLGMLPYSLESIRLEQEGMKVKKPKEGKWTSDDVINVKFNKKVRGAVELLSNINENIDNMKNSILDVKDKIKVEKVKKQKEVLQEKLKKMNEKLSEMESRRTHIATNKDNAEWQEVKNDDLRFKLYEEGFTIYKYNKKTKKTKEIHFEVYKRSASKSRTGQCIFINKKLKAKMQKWSRMGLKFESTKEHDLASLLAYESLVTSSLEGLVKINPKNMLIVDDVESVFSEKCAVVRENKTTKLLDSFEQTVKVENSLFDGESLLDVEFFPEGKSMLLLRQHMFKSAAFATNLQKFFTHQHKAMTNPKNENYDSSIPVNYDEWELEDMFGNKVLASQTKFIFTPSSLKSLKFSYTVGTKADMYAYWKELINEETEATFGICKGEKGSKFGYGEDGEVLHQTSYQHLNSMDLSKADVVKLAQGEVDYIINLKENNDAFINHINVKANNLNSNEMLSAIYNVNNDIVGTDIFKKFRREEINKQKTHVQKGKVRVNGDYLVLLGNPMEYLFHSIGKFDVNKVEELTLQDNQIYTKLFPVDKEYVGFRNPHTAPSNVFVGLNKEVEEIDTYFELTKNIICVNSVKHNILNKLSGADFDSDTLIFVDFDEHILKMAKQLNEDFLVCVNDIDCEPKPYFLDKKNESMAKVDNTLSVSQKVIGKTVNTAQLYMSKYWDRKRNNGHQKELVELLKGVNILTVCSGIAIDMSKKLYKLNLEAEIKAMENKLQLKLDTKDSKRKKPLFWKVNGSKDTSKKKDKKKEDVKKTDDKKEEKFSKFVKYDTPMDYLYLVLEKLPQATKVDGVSFATLLTKIKASNADRHQKAAILDEVNNMSDFIKSVNSEDSGLNEREKDERQMGAINNSKYSIQKKKVTLETMVSTIDYALDPKNGYANPLRLLKVLYETHPETFLEAFKK
ncbi:hypothetical protein H7S74_30315 [Priestia aryabhattai]|uniref:hypothetical protein n=1 Tax=Priestia aryabhattai TaxID=412384 RepID=UPI001ED3105A|nr:hypothetical protein [Priestia aryabhattai]MBY0094922.1 hypothetical protein [Priestia aryabhattai]MBY0105590.1 hypothetical protein [Priestia aryabhattai]